jgi:hypothetical protein
VATITAFHRTYAPVAAPILLSESDTLMDVRSPHAFHVCAAEFREVSRVRDLACPSSAMRAERLWT